MLYKILLSFNHPPSSPGNYAKAADELLLNNWKQVAGSEQIWMSEIIAYDALSAKFRVERDLIAFFKAANLAELSYAFQLSLGDVTTGLLKTPL